MYEVIITTKNGPYTEIIEDIKEIENIMIKYWDIYISISLKQVKTQNRVLVK